MKHNVKALESRPVIETAQSLHKLNSGDKTAPATQYSRHDISFSIDGDMTSKIGTLLLDLPAKVF